MLALRGVTRRERVQVRYAWGSLLVGVDPRTGVRKWQGLARMRQEHLRTVPADWPLDGVIRSGGSGGRPFPHVGAPTDW